MVSQFTKQQRSLLWICLIFSNFVFFISSAYITNSNDGSHFALVNALVRDRSVEITKYQSFVDEVDYASVGDDRILSDRIPGTAFLAMPFFLIGHIFSFLKSNLAEITVLFLPQLAGTFLMYLVFRLSYFYSKNFNISLLSAFLFSFTTLVWFESTHLFSHILSAASVFLAAYLAFILQHGEKRFVTKLISIASLLSIASIVEIQNILLVPAFVLYLFFTKKVSLKFWKEKQLQRGIFGGIIIFIAIYTLLISYNYKAFGELTIKSNKYNPNFTEEVTFSSSLSGEPIDGLDHLFLNLSQPRIIVDWDFGSRHNSPGFFILSPLLFLSVFGFIKFFKKYTWEASLFLYIILSISLIGAFHKTVITRHVFTILPFLWSPIIFTLERITDLKKWKKYIWLFFITTISIYSVIRVSYVMNNYWDRSVSNPFPFVRELLIFVIFYGFIFGLYFVFKKIFYYQKD